jgi:NADH:ubiquinone oxidoreductase subunit 6 (subunit J)
MADLIFWLFWGLTVASASIVAFSKNLIYAVFSLLGTFIGVAAMYIFLNADFVAVTQIVIYVGGILVLLIFGIMLTNRITQTVISESSFQKMFGLTVVFAVLIMVLIPVLGHTWTNGEPMAFQETIHQIGTLLFTDYILLFEVASILLLGALIGAATLARKER